MRAGEGPLAAVQAADVLHQRRPVGELLAAQVAAVLPLARVRDLVRLLILVMFLNGETIVHLIMNRCTKPFVLPNVRVRAEIDCESPHLQIRPRLEGPAAILAGERPLRRVDDGRVPRQQGLGAEGATALGAGERTRRACRRGDLRLEGLNRIK